MIVLSWMLKSCEKRLTKPSSTPFLSKLAQACITVSLLKLRHSELKYNKDYSIPIKRLQQRLVDPPSYRLPNTLIATKLLLQDARQNVQALWKHAVALREDFLVSKETNSDISKIVKRIQWAEELKRSYNKLRFLLNRLLAPLSPSSRFQSMTLLPNLLPVGYDSPTLTK